MGFNSLIDQSFEFNSIQGNKTKIQTTSQKWAFKAAGVNYRGEELITEEVYDNAFINTPIPRSEFQYSWIKSATDGIDAHHKRFVGYAPREGFLSSSIDGYVEAITFPTISSIEGS